MLQVNFVGVALREEGSRHCLNAFQPTNVAQSAAHCVWNSENIDLIAYNRFHFSTHS